jgi:tRNA A-37 threonylcarbamoyl transferase component Bud32
LGAVAPSDASGIGADLLLGGRYRLQRLIAKGGMAEVWEGHDEILTRAVAVKILYPHLAVDDNFVARFRREAVAAARLSHPNVVSTYDAGIEKTGTTTTAYIVMELLRGDTLRQLMAGQQDRAALAVPVAVGIALQMADALSHAHAAGLVHRDIKPANVLISDDDVWGIPRVKVTDLGIVKATGTSGLDLTLTGVVLGTPKYLSPEQIEGAEPDPRADLYALGVVTFEMLVGQPPFNAANELALAMKHLREAPPRVSDSRSVPPELDFLIDELLAKDPANRPQTAAEVRRRLAAIQADMDGRQTGQVDGLGRQTGQVDGLGGQTGQVDRLGGQTGRVNGVGRETGQLNGVVGRIAVPPAVPAGLDPRDNRTVSAPRSPSAPSVKADQTQLGPSSVATASPTQAPVRIPRGPGRLVAVLVVVGLVLVGSLLVIGGHHFHKSPGDLDPSLKAIAIGGYSEYLAPTAAAPDNPATLGLAFDGNPATAWDTDLYQTADLAGYGGIGIAIQLKARQTLHNLELISTTTGWTAHVYLADSVVQPLTAWGNPVSTVSGTNGTTMFDLGGHKDSCVLFWITNLGPARTMAINEIILH